MNNNRKSTTAGTTRSAYQQQPSSSTRGGHQASPTTNNDLDSTQQQQLDRVEGGTDMQLDDDDYDGFDPTQQQVQGQTSLMKYFGGGSRPGGAANRDNRRLMKPKKHPKSLLKDGISTFRYLENTSQSIFQIIMPWRQEQEEELKKKQKKIKQENEIRQTSLVNWVKKGGDKKSSNKKDETSDSQTPGTVTREEAKYQQQLVDGELDETSDEYHKVQKVVKVKEVQKVRLQDYTQNVQAILINPKWRPSELFTQLVEKTLTNDSQDSTASCGGKSTTGKKSATSAHIVTPGADHDMSDDDDGQVNGSQPQSTAFKGISMEEFSQLVIPKSVMTDGILFIWVEKEYIMDVCKFLEGQEFSYVENMCWVMLDETMKEEVEKTRMQDATPAFARENYTFLKKSKKTLLMFRRQSKDLDTKLELRHQRTGDVVFDWIDPINPFKKPAYYTYKLIETLLPKAMVDLKKSPHLKMIELWAQDDKPRKGWLKFIGLNQ